MTTVYLLNHTSVNLQDNEFLYLPNNEYIVISSMQSREHGVDVTDKDKWHNGKQNVIVEGFEIPWKLESGLLHLLVREPADSEFLQWPILSLTSDEPWDSKSINEYDLGGY